MIASRIQAARKRAGLTGAETVDRLRDTYGPYSQSTYRALERPAFDPSKRVGIYRELVLALAEVFECPVSDLVTDNELSELPHVRGKRRERLTASDPDSSKGINPVYVPDAARVAMRIDAFRRMFGYTRKSFAAALTFNGYRASEATYKRRVSADAKGITHEFVDVCTKVFTNHVRTHGISAFDRGRLLICEPDGQACPHCRPYLVENEIR